MGINSAMIIGTFQNVFLQTNEHSFFSTIFEEGAVTIYALKHRFRLIVHAVKAVLLNGLNRCNPNGSIFHTKRI